MDMQEKKVVFIGATRYEEYCSEGRNALLDAGYTLIENVKDRPYTEEELREVGPEIDAVICGCELWNENTISAAPRLKVIVKFGVGVDNIDLEAAKRHGVMVANCPGMNAVGVSEQTFALLLGCMRDVPAINKSAHQGNWDRRVLPEIYGTTFGILGFGAVGQEVGKRAAAFGANILAYDKYPNYEAAERIGARFCDIDEILAKSDILTVHLPSLPETKHFINADSIAKMKDGVVIVNAARGALVNEADVVAALESGKISAFGSDVFEVEPIDPNAPLARCEKAVISPHLAGDSRNSYRKIGLATARGVIAALSGETLPNRLA